MRGFQTVLSSSKIPKTPVHQKLSFPKRNCTLLHKGRSPLSSYTLSTCSLTPDVDQTVTAAQNDEEDGYCVTAYVTMDNKKDPETTFLEIEVTDYAGLMRVIAWTLNGLDIVAQNALIRTRPNGTAINSFWVTDRSGKKLSDDDAERLADRVKDYLVYCSPKSNIAQATDFNAGPISVSNSQHPEYTVVLIEEERKKPGFLLEIASVLSGLNVQVLQGAIEQSADGSGRLFRFWVRDKSGHKLDPHHVSALMYALRLGLGLVEQPIVPPNQEVMFSAN